MTTPEAGAAMAGLAEQVEIEMISLAHRAINEPVGEYSTLFRKAASEWAIISLALRARAGKGV